MSSHNSHATLSIPQRIEIVRDALGLKKGEYCTRVGISPNSYSNYMAGRVPSLEIIKKMIDEFSINAHWLVSGEGEMFVDTVAAKSDLPETGGKKVEDASRQIYGAEYVVEILEENRQLRRSLEDAESRYEEALDRAAELERENSKLMANSKGARKAGGGSL